MLLYALPEFNAFRNVGEFRGELPLAERGLQIVEGSALAKLVKDPIAAQWSATRTLSVDNAGIALPAADKTTTMGENKTSIAKEHLPQAPVYIV